MTAEKFAVGDPNIFGKLMDPYDAKLVGYINRMLFHESAQTNNSKSLVGGHELKATELHMTLSSLQHGTPDRPTVTERKKLRALQLLGQQLR